jgi:hypothetical protein
MKIAQSKCEPQCYERSTDTFSYVDPFFYNRKLVRNKIVQDDPGIQTKYDRGVIADAYIQCTLRTALKRDFGSNLAFSSISFASLSNVSRSHECRVVGVIYRATLSDNRKQKKRGVVFGG